MKLIEVRTKLEKGGVIRLSKPEVENMKLEEGLPPVTRREPICALIPAKWHK